MTFSLSHDREARWFVNTLDVGDTGAFQKDAKTGFIMDVDFFIVHGSRDMWHV